MKSTVIVHPSWEVIFPIVLELCFNLEAGREADGIKAKCWELATASSAARTCEEPPKLPSPFCSHHRESTSTKWYFQALPMSRCEYPKDDQKQDYPLDGVHSLHKSTAPPEKRKFSQ